MILYTMMPVESIFPHSETGDEVELIDWQGVPLYVQKAENYYRVIRVASTNPNDFLNEKITPGSMISLSTY
ncbi:YlzJ-like family protein [Bacillus sp. REN10]|uniref:YlzJ-like family protein n=1 Tax=Bacillus sp. REN10 TaxID=2782541 RepID=UPI00193B1777|nr:YlzJ-like family protein [Bacillus sp. REN10]